MDAPPALPARILVMGASAVVYTSWMGGPRTDLAYPRVIEAALLQAGQAAEVRVSAIPADRTSRGLRKWQQEILQWSPDVVVLHYGHADLVHLFLPRWLERHANNPTRRPGRVRHVYRRYGLRPMWKLLVHAQTALDARVGGRRVSRRHRRIAADLGRLVECAQLVANPLVLIPTIHQPGPSWAGWFPGAAGRMATMSDLIGELVERSANPDVRAFPLADIVAAAPAGDDGPTPDGGHFTPAVHRAVGRAMAEVIVEWAAKQPHLQPLDDGYWG